MLLPAFLPQDLSASCAGAETDQELFSFLTQHTAELTTFFEYATDDETWSDIHRTFMHNAMGWLTVQFLYDRLSLDFAQRIAAAIHKHYTILDPLLPRDLTVRIQGHSFYLNSLLFGTASERLLDLMRSGHPENNALTLDIPEIPPELFSKIAGFVMRGDFPELWKEDREYLFKLLREAIRLELTGLQALCEEVLKRYIHRSNVIDILIMAHNEGWPGLKQSCIDFLNDLSLGFKLTIAERKRIDISQKDIPTLGFEFLGFTETSLEYFAHFQPYITHLICSGSLTEDPNFSTVVRACPQLLSLDLSRSFSYTEHLADIDPSLQELDISKCGWLTDASLKQLVGQCPNLLRLNLSGTPHITFKGWSELKNLPQLISLDISRSNISNDDFSLILKTSPRLIELNIEECRHLSSKGFFAISHHLPQLAILNVARTNIDDASLIDIATRCPVLRILNIARCEALSEKGVIQALQQAAVLAEITVATGELSESTLEKISSLHPFLNCKKGSFY